jgi:glutaredoxin 3
MSVIIYTTPTCGYCNLAKSYLKKNNISYTEYDVSKDINKAREMITKSGQMGVPVIEINGKILVGFDENQIKKALH